MTDYDTVIFDKDGVIVTLGEGGWWELHEYTVEQALTENGVTEEHSLYDEVRDSLISAGYDEDRVAEDEKTGWERLQDLAQQDGLNPHRLWESRERYSVTIQTGQFTPCSHGYDGEILEGYRRGLHEDVAVLPELADAYDLGIVTNNKQQVADHVLNCTELVTDMPQVGDLGDMFKTVHGISLQQDDNSRRKPNPHYLHEAMADLDAQKALYVGDKESDIEAAERASKGGITVDSVFIPARRPNHEKNAEELADELSVTPDYAVDSLDELADL